ncbi:hypothetical protein MXB_5368 [Myxobolus squamalis]|nr:hypothetical protein MXB_5368 [Myxobolus squamalis]
MIQFGETLSDQEIAEKIKELDKDGDGTVDFNEFCQMMD